MRVMSKHFDYYCRQPLWWRNMSKHVTEFRHKSEAVYQKFDKLLSPKLPWDRCVDEYEFNLKYKGLDHIRD